MKTTTRTLRAAAALVCAGGLVVLVAKESPAAKASIRPTGTVASADLPSLAKISFQQALAAALAKVPGSVIKGELEVEDGNLMYSFEIVGADKKVREVEIDAGNGKVLNTEDEEDEKEDKAAEAKKP